MIIAKFKKIWVDLFSWHLVKKVIGHKVEL